MDINTSKFNKQFPLEIKDFDQEITEELLRHFKGEFSGFVRVGPKNYVLPIRFRQEAADLYNMPVRRDDIFVVTYPRSGTTLTQELVWLIANDLDFEKAAKVPLVFRFPFREHSILYHPDFLKMLEKEYEGNDERLKVIRESGKSGLERIANTPSPRFIKSHFPPSLLPPNLLDARVVFVARDPRDVAVSFYYHNKLIRTHDFQGDFKTYWDLFVRDLVVFGPVHEFNKELWALRNHPNVLFLFYEDLVKDKAGNIKKIAKFLNKELTQEQIERLCNHVQVDNFRNNNSVNKKSFEQFGIVKPGEQPFIRKGKAGGWRDHFDEEMTKEAEKWMDVNLRGTDLKYPTV